MSSECVGCGVKGTAVQLREVRTPSGYTYSALVCGSCRGTTERSITPRPERRMRVPTEIEKDRASRHECIDCGTQLYKKDPHGRGRYPTRCVGCKAAA